MCLEWTFAKENTLAATRHTKRWSTSLVVREMLKKVNIKLPHDPANPLPSIYPEELKAVLEMSVYPCS